MIVWFFIRDEINNLNTYKNHRMADYRAQKMQGMKTEKQRCMKTIFFSFF